MNKYDSAKLSEILDKLSDETKNCLIKALLENDKENVSIVAEPIYKKITTANGTEVGVYIDSIVYGVAVTHKAEEHRYRDSIYRVNYVDDDKVYRTVDANKNNLEEIVYKIFDNGGFDVKITCIDTI